MRKSNDVAPCFINEGTIYQKKDMLRALETLENVGYEYIVEGHVVRTGKGAICKVFASRNSATLIINNCVFINVLSFDYLNFRSEPTSTEIELIEDDRTLRLVTIDEEVKAPETNREMLASVDQFDDEETFALLEDSEAEDEE
jgi:hypothetical protein